MDRYRFTKKEKDKKLKMDKYKAILYPEVILRDNDIYIYTKDGDRLDLLSYKYYGDVTLWWIIAQANHIGKGSFIIKPGTHLRIPLAVEAIMNDFRKINEDR